MDYNLEKTDSKSTGFVEYNERTLLNQELEMENSPSLVSIYYGTMEEDCEKY